MRRGERALGYVIAATVVGWLLLLGSGRVASGATESGPDVPPWVACAFGPDGEPIRCRCQFSDPVGMLVDDPADCPEPPPPSTTVVDCWLPTGEPCSSSTTTVYDPTPADVNDLPIEPTPVVPVVLEPTFTG